MPNVVLVVVEESEMGGRTPLGVVEGIPLKPLLVGHGDVNLLCGDCGFHIAENLQPGQVSQMLLQCPRCKKFNETRT